MSRSLFGFHGRSGRADLWLALCAALALKLALGQIVIRDLAPGAQAGVAAMVAIVVWVCAAAGARRLHDLGKPASLLLAGFAAIVLGAIGLATSSPISSIILLAAAVPLGAWSLWLLAGMLSAPGQSAANVYGSAPDARTASVPEVAPALAIARGGDVGSAGAIPENHWLPGLNREPGSAAAGRERRVFDNGRPDGLPDRRSGRFVTHAATPAPARRSDIDVVVPTYSGGDRRTRDTGPPAGQPDRRGRAPKIVSAPADARSAPYAGPERRTRSGGPPPGNPERRARPQGSARPDRAALLDSGIAIPQATSSADSRAAYSGPERRTQNAEPPQVQPDRRSRGAAQPSPILPKAVTATTAIAASSIPAPAKAAASVMPAAAPVPSPFDAPPVAVGQIYVGPERRVSNRGRPAPEPERRKSASGFGRRTTD